MLGSNIICFIIYHIEWGEQPFKIIQIIWDVCPEENFFSNRTIVVSTVATQQTNEYYILTKN